MLKESSILFTIAIISLTVITFQDIDATPYNWTADDLNFSWTTITGANDLIAIDLDADGEVDNIYRWAYGGGNYTFTKVIGNGVSSVSVANSGTGTNLGTTLMLGVFDDEIYIGSTLAINDGFFSRVNIVNGTIHADEITVTSGNTHISSSNNFVMKSNWGTPTYGLVSWTSGALPCAAFGNCANYEVSNSTHAIIDSSNTGNFAATAIIVDNSPDSIYFDWSAGYAFGLDRDHVDFDYLGGYGREQYGWCSGTTCDVLDEGTGTTFDTLIPLVTFDTVVKDYDIQLYGNGFALPVGDNLNDEQDFWWNHFTPFSNFTDNSVKAANLHYKILDSVRTGSVPFAIYDDGTNEYILEFYTDDIKYAPIPSNIINRSWEFVVADDWTGGDIPTLDTDSALPNYNMYMETPVTNYASVNNYGGFLLPSGYKFAVDSGATSRDILSLYSNSLELFPVFEGLTTGLTTLSIEITNAPDDYAVLIYDLQTFNGINYLWSANPLAADDTVSVDLPTSECVLVVGVTTDVIEMERTEFGQLCATGAMPKTLIYSSNLAFTFWSLPFGASHDYFQASTNLKTQVRSDTQPFDYTVKVYHNNGTIFNSTTYTGVTTNSTTFDTRNFNASGSDFPSRMEILDGTGNIMYYATIGFPNYFSSISSYYAQWFEVDGFNLLYMLPIIFAAMFTRNTVGIGTGLTVAFISVLAWTGIIVIDEVIVYALIFIAILGMLAYRQLNR